jgi:Ca2+-transporting ATPase
MHWYQREIDQVFADLNTSEHGLADSEVRERLHKFGPNKLAEEEKISKLKILLHQFKSPLIYILLIAAVVTAFLQEYKDTGVIAAVLLLNALIGYIQEVKAEKQVRALKKMVVAKARVIRDGKEVEINGEEVVPGDLVLLASGGRVPADVRLIKTIELRVDESMLTGESIPAEKTSQTIAEDNLTPGDQRNMGFLGTVVVNGRAKGVVVATGPRTVLGHIARDVQEVIGIKAPLQEKIDRLYHRRHRAGRGLSAVPHRHPGGRKRQRHVHDRGGGRGGHHTGGPAHRGDHRPGHRGGRGGHHTGGPAHRGDHRPGHRRLPYDPEERHYP